MGTLAAADAMMSIAEQESAAAGAVLAPALTINFQFKLCAGAPVELDKAGRAWRDAAQRIQRVGGDLRQAVARVPRDAWSADDRTAYEQKVREFCAQLDVMYAFCLAVGIALTTYAYALFVYAIFAAGMGTFLAALALMAAGAAASGVGAPVYAQCLATASTCVTVTWAATASLAGAAELAAAVFQGGAISSAVAQHFKGNDAALGDLVQAEAAGSAAALANLTQNVTNGGLAYLDKSRTGRPLTSIDLDADRDKDRTWLVGGGAQGQTRGGTEIAAAGHVRVGDRGLMGVDAAGTYQDWGGKAGWTEDRRGEDTFFGGAEYGRESRRTGHGGTIEIEGEHNIAQNKTTVKGSAGHTYHSGQTIKVDGAASIDRGAEQDNVTSGR